MKYDFKRALVYFTKDKGYKKKLAVVSSYIFCSIFSLTLAVVLPVAASKIYNNWLFCIAPLMACIAIISFLAMQGYVLETGVLRLKNSESDLPELKNFWHQVLLCIKSLFGGFLLYLPIFVIGLLIFFFDPNYFSERSFSYSGVGLPLDIVANIIYFVFMFFSASLLLNFLEKNSPLEFLNFKKAFGRIKSHFIKYLILLSILLAVQVLAGLLSVLSIVTVIGIIFIPVIALLSAMVSIDFIVQFSEISNSEKLNCTEGEEKAE